MQPNRTMRIITENVKSPLHIKRNKAIVRLFVKTELNRNVLSYPQLKTASETF